MMEGIMEKAHEAAKKSGMGFRKIPPYDKGISTDSEDVNESEEK